MVYREHIDSTSIRLLRISSSHDGQLSGTLKIFPLAKTPPFYTASYTWGRETFSNTTVKLKTGSLPVLPSLVPFLRMIGGHDSFNDQDWWWIDSLCIDLQDAPEREKQVGIMASIYKRAKKAVIWLGQEQEDGNDCTGAVDFLHHLSNIQRTLSEPTVRLELRGPEFTAQWAAVGNLLARPWWTRVWTLQEFVLPREAMLFCGSSSITRGKFKSAMYSIFKCSTGVRDMKHELVPRAHFDSAFNRRRIHQWHTNPESRGIGLVAILAYLGNHSASDPRDRVYSVLGLITARDRKLVGSPEYTSSVQHQYAKLVRSFWNAYQDLDIICFSHLFGRFTGPKDTGWEYAAPSWAPDWRVHTEFASPVPLMASQSASETIGNFRPLHSQNWKVEYDAPGKKFRKLANVRFHDNLKEMWCDGVVLDTVNSLGALEGCGPRCYSFICAGETPSHGLLQSRQLQAHLIEPSPLALLEAIARSLVIDRQDKYLRFRAPQHYVSDFLVLCHDCLEEQDVDPLFVAWFRHNRSMRFGNQTLESLIKEILSSTEPALFDDLPPPTLRPASMSLYPPRYSADAEADLADDFLSRFSDTVRKKSRRLMSTDTGYIGMAPCRARVGDTVVVLFGCSIPLVLRQIGTREAWQVIGEAYVNGFMNGEVGKLVKKEMRSVKRFRLV